MGRILAIDYGKKRVGMAWTDPLRLSINPLETVDNVTLKNVIQNMMLTEEIDIIVLGFPKDSQGNDTKVTQDVLELKNYMSQKYPDIEIALVDESYSSQEAIKYMVQQGWKQKDRRNKSNVDKISAAIILQRYLDGY